jgi:cytochrome c553
MVHLTADDNRAGLSLCGALMALAALLFVWPGGPVGAQEAGSQAAAAQELERALTLEPDIENGLTIYRSCATCHQPEGWGLPDGSYPQLAGQHKQVVIKQLADIRAGVRGNAEMLPWASAEKIGGAQAVADVAGYIDTLELSVAGGKGPGTDLERGASLYAATCARCHGAEGEGDGPRYVPRIQSQHYAYLLRQFQSVRDGKRGNADPEMASHVKGISDSDARAILDHVSRLEPPEAFQAPPGWRNPDFPR